MAVELPGGICVAHLQQLSLCCAQAQERASFYETALGFRRISLEHLSGARARKIFGVGGRVLRISIQLGAQQVSLIQFVDQPGRSYPAAAGSSDLVFQHFAIVVADMSAAMAQLQTTAGWTPITRDGPQLLPQSSGGVTAFKFRDPEGHPLELLAFPADNTPRYWQGKVGSGSSPFLGIDHSAISVSDSQASIAFYEALGLKVSNRSVNEGAEQARLDNVDQPVVEVIAMATAANETPHLELLCYRQRGERPALDLRANDIAATCLFFDTEVQAEKHDTHGSSVRHLRDPDGHHLAAVDPAIE